MASVFFGAVIGAFVSVLVIGALMALARRWR